MFSSSRSKSLSFCTLIKIYKSPFPAPLCPGSPSPEIRILVPVSTPEGIDIEIVFCFLTLPVPLHFKQGFLIEEPSPPHEGQGRSIEKNPDVDLTFPCPLHEEQVLGPVLSALPVAEHKSQPTYLGIHI